MTSDPSGASSAGDTSVDPQDAEPEIRAVAQSYVDAVNADDEEAATELTCTGADAGSLFEVAGGEDSDVSIGEVKIYADDYATVEIFMGDPSNGATPLPLEYHDEWCVAV